MERGLLQLVDDIAPLEESNEKAVTNYVMVAILTYPAWFDARQINALEQAATAAGITVYETIPEPYAAALNYFSTLPPKDSKNGWSVVLDIGGETFDVSMVMHENDSANKAEEDVQGIAA